MAKTKFKNYWLDNLKIGDLVGVRTPYYASSKEKLSINSALVISINKRAETIRLLYPIGGKIINCHFEQIFPFKRIKI